MDWIDILTGARHDPVKLSETSWDRVLTKILCIPLILVTVFAIIMLPISRYQARKAKGNAQAVQNSPQDLTGRKTSPPANNIRTRPPDAAPLPTSFRHFSQSIAEAHVFNVSPAIPRHNPVHAGFRAEAPQTPILREC